MRKSHSKDFKVKVALEAIKNEMSIQELAQKFEILSNVVDKKQTHLI